MDRVTKSNPGATAQHRTQGETSSDSHSESLPQHLVFVLIILCFICSEKGTSPSSSNFSCCDISAAIPQQRQLLLETHNNDEFLRRSSFPLHRSTGNTEGCAKPEGGGDVWNVLK